MSFTGPRSFDNAGLLCRIGKSSHPSQTEASPKSYEIGVFLSSNFRAFRSQRVWLMKQVFPELHRRVQEKRLDRADRFTSKCFF
jgi:hypothetical protein